MLGRVHPPSVLAQRLRTPPETDADCGSAASRIEFRDAPGLLGRSTLLHPYGVICQPTQYPLIRPTSTLDTRALGNPDITRPTSTAGAPRAHLHPRLLQCPLRARALHAPHGCEPPHPRLFQRPLYPHHGPAPTMEERCEPYLRAMQLRGTAPSASASSHADLDVEWDTMCTAQRRTIRQPRSALPRRLRRVDRPRAP